MLTPMTCEFCGAAITETEPEAFCIRCASRFHGGCHDKHRLACYTVTGIAPEHVCRLRRAGGYCAVCARKAVSR